MTDVTDKPIILSVDTEGKPVVEQQPAATEQDSEPAVTEQTEQPAKKPSGRSWGFSHGRAPASGEETPRRPYGDVSRSRFGRR